MAAESAPVCRYYVNGSCTFGSRCTYRHDRTARPDNTCRYYLKGQCAYGNACRYDHVKPTATKAAKAKPPSVKAYVEAKAREESIAASSFSLDAPVFVPSWLRAAPGTSYAKAAGGNDVVEYRPLCPYFEEEGQCEQEECLLVHGLLCDMCGRWCLHPNDSQQRSSHSKYCLAQHEEAMEEAFAEARSRDKQCGVCMENIREKNLRFGILENCQHCYCLNCIREWRKSQGFDTKIVRSCPECRVHSDFVIPAVHWVEDVDQKQKLIDGFRANTAKKICKYYKNGALGEGCPFGNRCFYRHELPDGSIDPGESPRARRKPTLASFIFTDLEDDEEDMLLDAMLRDLLRVTHDM